MDWQLPRAPVRFPLRDALVGFHDPSRSAAEQELDGGTSGVSSKGPLKVHMTQKARHQKYLGHRKRYDLDPPELGEIHAQPLPRPPPETTARKPAKKALNSYGTDLRVQAMRNAEDAAWSSWKPKEDPHEAPQNLPSSNQVIRSTLTSSARAVLSHSRRFAAESLADPHHQSSSHGSSAASLGKSTGAKKPPQDPLAAWSPARQSRGLPKPVKEWVCRGLEFTDGGLGIGNRLDGEIQNRANRAPGHIYAQDFGNIGRYKSEASMPTKQPEGRHTSTETHKMGARRDTSGKRDRQRPGPGTYEFMGFAQELDHKLSKRPQGEAPRSLSPPGSPKGSKTFQASTSSVG